jgi:phosphatidylinositol glycan class V
MIMIESAPNEQHRTLLRRLSAASSLVFGLVLVASSRLPLFDASPTLVPGAHSPLLRWDIFHFLNIARHGYVYEHEWAFLPAAPWIIRHSLAFLERLTPSTLSHLIFAVGISVLASETVQTLYLLSLHHFKSPHMALLASMLAILPSSPATLLFVPYNEPFFTYLSYRGELTPRRIRLLH